MRKWFMVLLLVSPTALCQSMIPFMIRDFYICAQMNWITCGPTLEISRPAFPVANAGIPYLGGPEIQAPFVDRSVRSVPNPGGPGQITAALTSPVGAIQACEQALFQALDRSADIAHWNDNRSISGLKLTNQVFLFDNLVTQNPLGRLLKLELIPANNRYESPYFINAMIDEKQFCLVYQYNLVAADQILDFREGTCEDLRTSPAYASSRGQIFTALARVADANDHRKAMTKVRDVYTAQLNGLRRDLEAKLCSNLRRVVPPGNLQAVCREVPELKNIAEAIPVLVQEAEIACPARVAAAIDRPQRSGVAPIEAQVPVGGSVRGERVQPAQ